MPVLTPPHVAGGAFVSVEDKDSPFGYKRGEGVDEGAGEPDWIVSKLRFKTDANFDSLGPIDGKITGAGEWETACSDMLRLKSSALRSEIY